MELVTETRIPDLNSVSLADLERYEEARIVGGIIDGTTVPAARFQSSL